MTDPYPADLFEEAPQDAPVSIDAGTREIIRALTRIAAALEKAFPGQNGVAPAVPARPQLAPLPPVQTTNDGQANVCPIHNTPWKVVPAGVSKKTGKPYDAFRACSTQGCDQRPR